VFLCSAPVTSVVLNVTKSDHVTVGDVIHCSANTIYPPVSYYWQQYVNESWWDIDDDDDDDDDGSDGPMLTLSTAGVKLLRCVAYNIVGNKTYSVTSDKVTLYVKPGKCFQTMPLSYVDNIVKLCSTVNVVVIDEYDNYRVLFIQTHDHMNFMKFNS